MPPKKPKKPHIHSWETKNRMTAAEALRERFLGLVTDGMSIGDSIRAVERTESWYTATRANHPVWARKVTNVRLALKDAALPGMDFVQFRHVYFNNYTAPHHYQMIEAFELAKPGSTTAVLAFPGAGKTTLLQDMYCYLLAEDPNETICVISEGQDLSRKIIGQVSDRMSDRERFLPYHLRYGPFRAQAWDDANRAERDPTKRPWTADYFKILAANEDQKEPSIESRGVSGRLYGGRYKWMIFDDMQSNESLQNTSKLMQSMRTTWKSRTILAGRDRGKMLLIGSRVGQGDVYEAMDDEGMIDTLVTIPALTENIPPEEHFTRVNKKIIANPDCTAKPTWDALSLQDLAEIRAFAGEEVWARTYMQDMVAATSVVFTEEMIEAAKDRTRTLGPASVGTETWASVDPALDSGTCAYLVAAISPNELTILDCIGVEDTYNFDDIYNRVYGLGKKYRPGLWIVEENNFQKGLNRDPRMHTAIRNSSGGDLVAHRTGRNKDDAIMGIRMMANAFIDEEIRIPWGDEATQKQMAPLVQELRTWKPKKRGSELKMDRVMALWFVWMRWQTERESMSNVIPLLARPTWVRNAM